VVDSFIEGTESSVKLERADTGVYMTVTSLSPFVLSWKKAVCNHGNNKDLTYDAKGNTITETCPSCDHKATLTVEVEESCVAGTQIDYQLTASNNLIGTIATAYKNEKTSDVTADMPTEPGKYSLKVGIERNNGVEWYLEIPFTVTAAPAMPATGDNSLPLVALLGMLALAVTGSFMLRKKANA